MFVGSENQHIFHRYVQRAYKAPNQRYECLLAFPRLQQVVVAKLMPMERFTNRTDFSPDPWGVLLNHRYHVTPSYRLRWTSLRNASLFLLNFVRSLLALRACQEAVGFGYC